MFLFRMVLARRPLLRGVALAAAVLLLAAATAAAQQGWQFYGGQGRPGYNAPAAAGYVYTGGYYEQGPAATVTPAPGYFGTAFYAPTYVYGTPSFAGQPYLYSSLSPAQTAAYYGSAAPPDRDAAVIDLRVPQGAVVLFDGKKTTQTGGERRFFSPSLKAGRDYTYEVEVRWNDSGRERKQQRTIDVRAGERVNFDFTRSNEG
jgi:uncharacterized protein (TIGR03000 family)